MAERPIFPPRRDEIALASGGAFTQRVISYLEDVATLTNETPDVVLDDALGFLGGINTANIIDAQQHEFKKFIADALGYITETQAQNGKLIAQLKQASNLIADLFQMTILSDTTQGTTAARTKELSQNVNCIYELMTKTEQLRGEVKKNNKDIADLQQLHGGS